jgi:hypothetical protein
MISASVPLLYGIGLNAVEVRSWIASKSSGASYRISISVIFPQRYSRLASIKHLSARSLALFFVEAQLLPWVDMAAFVSGESIHSFMTKTALSCAEVGGRCGTGRQH